MKKTASPTKAKPGQAKPKASPTKQTKVPSKPGATGKTAPPKEKSQVEDKRAFVASEKPKEQIITENNFVCVKTVQAFDESVECLFQIDDDRIVSTSYNSTMKLWSVKNLNELKPLMVYKGHTDAIFSAIKFTANKIISCSRDKTIRIWNTETGKELSCITGKEPYYVVKQISDAQVAVAGGDKEIRVFNLCNEEETKEEFVLEGQECLIRAIEVFAGNIICSAGEDKLILIWNFEKKKILGKLEGHTDGITCLKRLKDGNLASGSNDSTIRIWDLKNQKCLAVLGGITDRIMSLEQVLNGDLVSGGSEWNLVVWGNDGKVKKELEGHEGSVNAILCMKNGIVVTGSADNTLKFWK